MNIVGDRFYIYFFYIGYIKFLIVELWLVLECGVLDIFFFIFKSWLVDVIDRLFYKVNIKIMLYLRDIFI